MEYTNIEINGSKKIKIPNDVTKLKVTGNHPSIGEIKFVVEVMPGRYYEIYSMILYDDYGYDQILEIESNTAIWKSFRLTPQYLPSTKKKPFKITIEWGPEIELLDSSEYDDEMPPEKPQKLGIAGLQIFDAKGNIILDTSDSLCRILGQVKADTEAGSFTPPGLEPNEKIFAFSTYSGRGYGNKIVPLTIYITNNQTINWRYRMDVAINGLTEVITYGSY